MYWLSFSILLLNQLLRDVKGGSYQKCLAELGRMLVREEVGLLVAEVMRFLAAES